MTSVFLGGSRRLGRINDALRSRIENIIAKEFRILVGDATGGDRALQSYLADRGYRHVVVYCTGGPCRNNLGGWDVRSVDAPDVRPGTRAFYSVKDDAMVRDADHALFVWDGKSKGTLRNIVNMAKLGKSSVVYVSPAREFLTVKDVDSLKGLGRSVGPSTRAYLDEASSSLEAGDGSLLPAI